MKKLLLLVPTIALLAVSCSSNQSTFMTVQPTPVAQTTPTPTATPTPTTGWQTFIDSRDQFTIQYPDSLGKPTVDYDPDGSKGAQLSWPNSDFLVYISFNDASLQQWLKNGNQLTNPKAIVVNGLSGTMYAGTNNVQRIFLNGILEGKPTAYYIYFGNNGDPLPDYWQQMLDSFKNG